MTKIPTKWADFPSPGELADYIQDKPKALGEFGPKPRGRKDARCCLGHYRDMLGVEGSHNQGTFLAIDDFPKQWSKYPTTSGRVGLPRRHWMLQKDGQTGLVIQIHLANLNDNTRGNTKVIGYLRDLEARGIGRRRRR